MRYGGAHRIQRHSWSRSRSRADSVKSIPMTSPTLAISGNVNASRCPSLQLLNLGFYARPLPINISTLMYSRPFDSNRKSRSLDFLAHRAAIWFAERNICLRYRSGPHFDWSPIIVETRDNVFAFLVFHTNVPEACVGQ